MFLFFNDSAENSELENYIDFENLKDIAVESKSPSAQNISTPEVSLNGDINSVNTNNVTNSYFVLF